MNPGSEPILLALEKPFLLSDSMENLEFSRKKLEKLNFVEQITKTNPLLISYFLFFLEFSEHLPGCLPVARQGLHIPLNERSGSLPPRGPEQPPNT